MASTALARLRDEPHAVALLTDASDRIAPFLPKGVDLARVVLTTRLAIRKNPKILECEPESIINAVAQVQQWGLEIGTTAHLVPYGNACTPIADYKGLAELVVGSGVVRHCEARCVYANEPFRIKQGLAPELEHHPVHIASERGALIGAYVIFRLAFQNVAFEFYPIADIDAIRKKHSKQWKEGPCPPWYAMKTAIRQGVKLIPKNPRLAAALASVMQIVEQEETVAREAEGEFQVLETERPSGNPGAGANPTGATHPSPAASSSAPAPSSPAPGKATVSAERASDGPIPQPTPAGAPNPTKVITPTSITDEDLAWAAKVPLRGKPDKWGGNGGKPMGELPTSLLEQVRDFFAKKRSEKMEPDEALDAQVRAASIILADRERAQGQLFDGDDDGGDDDIPSDVSTDADDRIPF